MSEPTNAQLAKWLRACAEKLAPPPGYDWASAPLTGSLAEQAQFFRLAAQRLEGEISEAKEKPPFRQACRTYSGPDPQDCNWPFCGCDDHANKVLETLEECGYAAPDEARRLRSLNDEMREALKDVLHDAANAEHRENARAALEAAAREV